MSENIKKKAIDEEAVKEESTQNDEHNNSSIEQTAIETKVPLKEVIEQFNNFYTGKIKEEDLNEFGKKIDTKVYIRIMDKMVISMNIINTIEMSSDIPEELVITQIYKELFFKGLLAYTNIDVSDENLQTFDNYDLLYPVFSSMMLEDKDIKRDYDMLKQIILDSINIGGIIKMIDISEELDYNSMTLASQSNKELIEYMEDNKELMGQLNAIAQYNNPLMSSFVEGLKEGALSNNK